MTPPLGPDDRVRLETLFDRAADLPTAERAAFVARECGANVPLRDELARLLAGLAGADARLTLASAGPLAPGTTIGAYRLLERVGQGGMGEVYAAEQRTPVVRRVALKVIKLGMDSAEIVARFEAERQAMARMTHPNIAQVYDGGTMADGRPYFVMEYVAGVPITEYCDRGKLTTRERLDLFLGICAGVQHAHLKGVIHRDLKPSNLLVTQQDGRALAKVIDFGVARAVSGRLADLTLHTMVGQILGTPEYMSPEQADPTALDIDTRSDVYSLGVVLYQLVSGLLPFERPKTGDAGLLAYQRALLEQDPPTPSARLRRQTATAAARGPLHGTDGRSLVQQLAGDLDWICVKALEKSPARRYQSVAELAMDVRRHLVHEPVLAARPSRLYRTRKFIRRNRAAVLAGSLVTASGIAGAFGIVAGRIESEAAAQVADALRPYADASILAQLVERADHQLWPPYPDKIAALGAWTEEAAALLRRLPGHRADLLRLEADDQHPETAEHRSRRETLSRLVARLTDLGEPATGLAGGPEAVAPGHGWSVPKRLASARRLAEGYADGGEFTAPWTRNLAQIEAAYPDVDFSPPTRMGLVPIGDGPDPQSDLWEFAHVLTGRPAVRIDGRLLLTEDTGIVLVLIPATTFAMGDERPASGPPHEVRLTPYFLAKHEMTQAQWLRTTGSNPSRDRPDTWQPKWLASGAMGSLLHPVEQVSWWDCDTWLTRSGLSLPSEAQWECGARGGTTTSWWCGDDRVSLDGIVNLSDTYASKNGGLNHERAWEGNDGATMHAPVDSYRANGFGLHNVAGNVFEWCLDRHDREFYAQAHPPNPLARGEGDQPRIYRGGSYRANPNGARSATRSFDPPGKSGHAQGVRAARAITP